MFRVQPVISRTIGKTVHDDGDAGIHRSR
jgi:hypothetical protein